MCLHEIFTDHLLDVLQVVDDLNAAASIGVFAWLDDPIGIGLKALTKITKFLLLVHLLCLQLIDRHDIRLWHQGPWVDVRCFGVCLHISMQLAFCANLVNAIYVVIDLIWF